MKSSLFLSLVRAAAIAAVACALAFGTDVAAKKPEGTGNGNANGNQDRQDKQDKGSKGNKGGKQDKTGDDTATTDTETGGKGNKGGKGDDAGKGGKGGKGGTTSGTADLLISGITMKTGNSATSSTVKNVTVMVLNNGDADAQNPLLSLYLTTGDAATTEALETSSTLVKEVSLGKVKAGREKKRTFGGGLFKSFETSGTSFLAFVDKDNVVSESDETNNVGISQPLP